MPVFDLDVIIAMAEREDISFYEAKSRLAQLINSEEEEGE